MSNMNDCVDEIETNMHDHEIHSTKRTDVVDQMLNEINYRVLEINSLAVFFDKTTDHERIRQSLAEATENIGGDGTNAGDENEAYLDQQIRLIQIKLLYNKTSKMSNPSLA